MPKSNWLGLLSAHLWKLGNRGWRKSSRDLQLRRRSGSRYSAVPAMIEVLEPRRVLSGVSTQPDSYTAFHNQPYEEQGLGVCSNDTGWDGLGGSTLTAAVVSGPSHGSLTLDPDGSFIYTPNDEYVGADSFTYSASIGGVTSPPETVTFDVFDYPPTISGGDTSPTIHHDTILVVTSPVATAEDCDDDVGDLEFELYSDVSHGSLSFDSDGTYTYTPDAGYYGLDSFSIRSKDPHDKYSEPIDINIYVLNSIPVFAAHQMGGPDESYLDTDPEATSSSPVVIGTLEATDSDSGDTLTYSGTGPSFIDVASDGTIRVTNMTALMDYFDANATLTVAVSVTDGLETVASFFILDRTTPDGFIPRRYMYVLDTNGITYSPTNAAELKEAFLDIQLSGAQVSKLVIKGHGGPDGCEVGQDEWMTIANGQITVGNEDLTTLFNDVTDGSSKIYLRCCFSAYVAQPLAASLDGARVWGARRFTINVPGTPWGLYAWKSY